MFRRTVVRLAQEARQPSIRFPDRKAHSQSGSHEPHPHPAAPQDIAQNFTHFQEVFNSGPHFHPEKIQNASQGSDQQSSTPSRSSSSQGEIFEDVHDLPKRFWQTPTLAIEENEMDAIMSGGATLVQGK